jgi:hypothetical protein
MRRGGGQRGSALLIVFVFAAVIAIMLYREMPVAVFEAQRQKEELLIDRGDEYKHAVKLFVRKVGTFPPSIEALENTNRMRFLRHKFDDPFTGKDDWRLLHAGPGGMIVDSKVNTNKSKLDANGKPVAGNGAGSNTGFNSGSNTGFNSGSSSSFNSGSNSGFGSSFGSGSNSSFGSGFGSTLNQGNSRNQGNLGFGQVSNSDSSAGPEVTVATAPQRPPAIAANGSGGTAANNDLSMIAGENGRPNGQLIGQPIGQSGESSLPANSRYPQAGGALPPGTATDPAAGPDSKPENSGQNPQGLMRSMLNAPANPQTPQQQQGARQSGTIMSGGIAGVASKASGHTIKLVNDQDNYSLWEFYYDMTKEANSALAAATGGAQGTGNGMMNGNRPSNPSGASTFGSSNGFSLSIGNSNRNQTGNPSPAPMTNPTTNGPEETPNQ